MDDPDNIVASDLTQHPLWMPAPTAPSTVTLIPEKNATRVALAIGGSPTDAGAWAMSSLLLIPAGRNLPIGLGMALNKNFSHGLFLDQLVDQHGTALACHVDTWLRDTWCNS